MTWTMVDQSISTYSTVVPADMSRNLTIRKDFAQLYRRVLSLLCMREMSDVIQASTS
jgi:hypothetical protein